MMLPAAIAGVAAIAATGLWTANDPFVGKWELDVSRSTIVDQMIVEVAGPNEYTFHFEGGPPETVVADGTDQPGIPGTTLAVKAGSPRTLSVVRKQGGHIIVSADWTLSEDGRTLRDAFKSTQPDGSSITVDYLYNRMSGASGFAGSWESTTQPMGLKFELEIRPYHGDGLSFVRQGSIKSVIFDGKDHAVASATAGATASGKRQNERALALTDKTKGKVVDTQAFALSADSKTLTMHVHRTGQVTPAVFVFTRA